MHTHMQHISTRQFGKRTYKLGTRNIVFQNKIVSISISYRNKNVRYKVQVSVTWWNSSRIEAGALGSKQHTQTQEILVLQRTVKAPLRNENDQSKDDIVGKENHHCEKFCLEDEGPLDAPNIRESNTVTMEVQNN